MKRVKTQPVLIKIFDFAKKPKSMALIAVLAAGLLGGVLISVSHADSFAKGLEAEDGQVAGNAKKVADTAASGGNKVTFSSTTTGGGGGGGSTGDNDPTANTCSGNAFTIVGAPAELNGYKASGCEDFNNGLGGFDAYTGGGDGTVVSGSSRKPSQCSNGGGYLALKQSSDGSTCGGNLGQPEQQYGYWEVKMRTYKTADGGGPTGHPVLIIWSPGNVWNDGEMDFFETDIGDPAHGYMHCIGHPKDNCYQIPDNDVDYSQWHVYGFEWRADGGTGYIDGKKWWSDNNSGGWSIQKPGHMTIQLDCIGCGTPVRPAQMDVDWVHTYKK